MLMTDQSFNDDENAHAFYRDKSKSACEFCNGHWPSTDEIIAKFHACSTCDFVVHSSCRGLADLCVECTEGISEVVNKNNADLDVNSLRGKVFISLLQTSDINISSGTSIYARIQFYGTNQVHSTPVAVTENNSCKWLTSSSGSSSGDAGDGVLVFPINEVPLLASGADDQQQQHQQQSVLTGADMVVGVELWSASLLGFFDSLVAKTEISLLPLLAHPNAKMTRWFGIHNLNSSSTDSSHHVSALVTLNGKVLLSLLYRPQDPPHPHSSNGNSNNNSSSDNVANVVSNAQLFTRLQHRPPAVTLNQSSSDGSIQRSNTNSSLDSPLSYRDSRTRDNININNKNNNINNGSSKSQVSHISSSNSSTAGALTNGYSSDSERSGTAGSGEDIGDHSIGIGSDIGSDSGSDIGSDADRSESGSVADELDWRSDAGDIDEPDTDGYAVNVNGVTTTTAVEAADKTNMKDNGNGNRATSTASDLLVDSLNRTACTRPGDTGSNIGANRPIESLASPPTLLSATSAVVPSQSPLQLLSLAPTSHSTAEGTETVAEEVVTPMQANTSSVTPASTPVSTPTAASSILRGLAELGETASNVIGNYFYDLEGVHSSTGSNYNSSRQLRLQGRRNAGQGVKASLQQQKTLTVEKENGSSVESSEGVAIQGNAYDLHPVDNKGVVSGSVAPTVGTMHIHLLSATRSKVRDLGEGDYYISVSADSSSSADNNSNHTAATTTATSREWRTSPVYSSASPVFDAHFALNMRHFRSAVLIHLVDANTHKKIGVARVSVYSVKQRDADHNISDWRAAFAENIPILDMKSETDELGHFTATIRFEENFTRLYLSSVVQYAAESYVEDLSVEKLSGHIARFTAIFELFNTIYGEYLYIMAWTDPLLTSSLFLLFLYCTLYVAADYALSGVVFFALLLMTRMLVRRRSGVYKKQYVQKGIGNDGNSGSDKGLEYRPVATFRLAVLGYRRLPVQSVGRPSIRVSYVPMIERDNSGGNSGNSNNSSSTSNSNSDAAVDSSSLSMTTENGNSFVSVQQAEATRKEHIIGHINSPSQCLTCAAPNVHSVHGAVSSTGSNVSQLVSNIVGLDSGNENRELILQNVCHPWPGSEKIWEDHKQSNNGGSGGNSVHAVRSDTADIALVYPILQPLAAKVKYSHEPSLAASPRWSGATNNFAFGVVETGYDLHCGAAEGVDNTADVATRSRSNTTSSNSGIAAVNGIGRVDRAPSVDKSDRNVLCATPPAATGNASSRTASPCTTASSAADGNKTPLYVPWRANDSYVKLTLQFESKPSAALTFVSDEVGAQYIRIPLKDIAAWAEQESRSSGSKNNSNSNRNTGGSRRNSKNNCEVVRWFNASSAFVAHSPSHSHGHSNSGNDDQSTQLLLRLQLDIPSSHPTDALSAHHKPTPSQRETDLSLCLQKILSGSPRPGTSSSSSNTISVLWNMRDNVKYVQNLMNWLLDHIESAKNVLNWTSPQKTFPIYYALIALWLLTVFIPGRLLILTLGLYQFLFVVLPIPEGDEMLVRLFNLLQSVPNDNDLALLYAKERRAYQDSEAARRRETVKYSRLNMTLKTVWEGRVHIKVAANYFNSGAAGLLSSVVNGNTDGWVEVYLLLQGSGRLVWWLSEDAFLLSSAENILSSSGSGRGGSSGNSGNASGRDSAPCGQILLCGHAGVTEASPVDIRYFGDGKRLMAVFGKDCLGSQQKLSICCVDAVARDLLYRKISELVG